MIDTDKYEGHTEGPWHWDYFCLYNAIGKEMVQVLGEPCAVELVGEDWDDDTPTQQLMADAPLLLEEVERLREGRLALINEVIRIINNKTGERVDADLHDYIIDRLVNE